jgi:hypothetical protein
MAYVVSVTEKDQEKQNRSIRNAHERLTTAEADIDAVEASITALALDDLADVNAPSPTDGQAPVWDDGNSEWVAGDVAATGRELLTADRTYYVRSDGSDSNTGLADTAGGAFLTIQKAVDVTSALDLSTFNVTIQVRSGTFAGFSVSRPFVGNGVVTIQGDTTTPGNVIISTTGTAISASGAAVFSIAGFKITTTSNGFGIVAAANGFISLAGLMEYGAITGAGRAAMYANSGGAITVQANYTISAGAPLHWLTETGGRILCQGRTITLSGTPAFSSLFAQASRLSVMLVNANTFSGAATGTRYSVTHNSVIDTNGGGATYLPGNAAGSTATGGQYV